MKISYELNPPKILNDGFDPYRLKQDLASLDDKVKALKGLVDNIHITDSVLGVARLSSISIAREYSKYIKVRCSLRVRDRNFIALLQLVADAIMIGIDGLLIVKGDDPRDNSIDSGLKPSYVVKELNSLGFNKHIKLYLSIPCNPNPNVIERKVSAEPYGLITQTISSLDNLITLNDIAKAHNVKVLPCIMVPSRKNLRSAKAIGLDWSSYEHDPYSFIKQAYDICGEVLMTSPMSFDDGLAMVRRLRG